MYHRTSDLYYAAFLYASGVALQGTEREGKRVVFLFDNPSSDLHRSYFDRTGRVAGLTYADSVKYLKSMTFLP